MTKETAKPQTFIIDDREVVARDYLSNMRHEIAEHMVEMPDFVARMSAALVEKWGMVAGKPDGEDSSGRAKMAVLDPSEVVDRAVQTATILEARLREEGHFRKFPTYAELFAHKEQEEA